MSSSSSSRRPRPLEVAAVIFLLGGLAGWGLDPYSFDEKVLASDITQVPLLATAGHNLRIVLISVAGGVFFAVPTVLVAFWNGLLAGGLIAGIEPTLMRVPLLLHGIPEFSGQIAGTAAGLGVCREIVGRIIFDRPVALGVPLRLSLAAVVLTVLAAALESLVSPAVAVAVLK